MVHDRLWELRQPRLDRQIRPSYKCTEFRLPCTSASSFARFTRRHSWKSCQCRVNLQRNRPYTDVRDTPNIQNRLLLLLILQKCATKETNDSERPGPMQESRTALKHNKRKRKKQTAAAIAVHERTENELRSNQSNVHAKFPVSPPQRAQDQKTSSTRSLAVLRLLQRATMLWDLLLRRGPFSK